MTLDQILTAVAVVATMLAALLGLRAATVQVRDNIDGFMGDLQQQSRWVACSGRQCSCGGGPGYSDVLEVSAATAETQSGRLRNRR